ncbi:MAG TPA: flagellar hook-basal body complex protein FliE [Nocardioides bacterium]|uniref:flagellar hook-basal body complex protein FliE n=1 Tax=uncultured Nocardioides sp. TaxID=198441 RepID=UPI000EB882B2|nr:flagellar hook-basal body complex protein FliE [uncultured Nocardioides sp.]HCB04010.1 flagellar hook-basal body complex protein FliE [Nocardioides sp.]HRD62004.1 flagellar hook-basal body complex protein FliE [Nocardioides sp.]HRK47779.1 flagellar hook-basal body complex protein FliE [Nocardioides sp.]
MSVSGIEAAGFAPYVAPRVDSASTVGPQGPSGPSAAGADFGSLVLDGIDRLEQVQQKSDTLAVKAATGDLQSIHDYTIAATQAAVTTQVTVAVRNKAVEAFTEIMRMQA